jgi:hypothetical protein
MKKNTKSEIAARRCPMCGTECRVWRDKPNLLSRIMPRQIEAMNALPNALELFVSVAPHVVETVQKYDFLMADRDRLREALEECLRAFECEQNLQANRKGSVASRILPATTMARAALTEGTK